MFNNIENISILVIDRLPQTVGASVSLDPLLRWLDLSYTRWELMHHLDPSEAHLDFSPNAKHDSAPDEYQFSHIRQS
jgi:hypothetical protein